jgi:hypothetical protein
VSTLIASFVAILLAVAAMSVGILFGREPIRGSCGGIGCAACARGCKRGAAAGDAETAEREEEC